VINRLTTIILLLAAAAPSHGAAEPEPVTIINDTISGGESSTELERRANYELQALFRRKYPHIDIQAWSPLALPPGMAFSGAQMAMAMVGDAAPDIFWGTSDTLQNYARNGFLYPLDEYVETWERRAVFEGPLGQLYRCEGPDAQRHIYALPMQIGTTALFYNRRLLKEAGYDPYTPPADWDAWWDMCVDLTDKEPDAKGRPRRVGLSVGQYSRYGFSLVHFIPLTGGDWIFRDPDSGKWVADVDTPQAVRAFRFLYKLAHGEFTKGGQVYEGVIDIDFTSGRTKILHEDIEWARTGRIGMRTWSFYSTSNSKCFMDPEEWGVAGIPAAPDGRRANRLVDSFFCMRSTVADPAVRDACWLFISFMCSTEADEFRTRFYVENGAAKYVNPALLRQFGYDDEAARIPRDWHDAYETLFSENFIFNADVSGYSAMTADLNQLVRRMLAEPGMDLAAALGAQQERISRAYLYSPTPAERAFHFRIALIVIFGAAFITIASGFAIMRSWIRANRQRLQGLRAVGRVPARKHLLAWGLMLPALLSVLLWKYIPVLWGLLMAFMDYRIMGQSAWVGLDNFIHIFLDPFVRISLRQTFLYVFMSMTMGFAVPVVLACLLAEVPRGKVVFRTLFYLPAVTVGLVPALLWMQFYEPTETGLLNLILGHLNELLAFLHLPQFAHPVAWLQTKSTAMACVIIPGIWSGMGPGSILYLAGLRSIPEEYYEAADIDGAGPFKKAWHITIPSLAPLILVNFLGSFIGSFHSSANILAMTGGGPDYATHVISIEVFKAAYLLMEYGKATALCWMLATMLIGFTVIQMRIMNRLEFRRAAD